MPVAQTNRERLRSGLLGPLGQEVTEMLMEELDHAGLRTYIDQRFEEQDRKFEKRFEDIEKRFERIEDQLVTLAAAVVDLSRVISESTRPGNAIVYTVCATFALVSLTALVTVMLQVFAN